MKRKLFSLALISSLILTEFLIQLYIPLVIAKSYSLGIELGDECTWETTEYDEDAIDELISYGVLSSAYKTIEKGFKLKLEVDLIDETDEGWEISVDGYIGEDAESYDGSITWMIFKDPEDFAEETFDDEGVAVLIVFLPVDIEDYLEEFRQNIPSSWQSLIKVEENKLIQNISAYSFDCAVISEYNKQGITKEYSIIYEGEIAYKRELISVENNLLLYTITTIVIIIGIVGGITVLIVVYTRNKKKRKERVPIQMAPYSAPYTAPYMPQLKPPISQKEAQQPPTTQPLFPPSNALIKFCPNCGTPRSLDARFCVNCGGKYD